MASAPPTPDVPEQWLTGGHLYQHDERDEFGTDDPMGPNDWVPAESQEPNAVERWTEQLVRSVAELAGIDREAARDAIGPIRFEVSTTGKPRELRFSTSSHWETLVLWGGISIWLWVEHLALWESQRIRFGRHAYSALSDDADAAEPEPDENGDDLDVDALLYRPLAEIDPTLEARMRDRYAELLLRFGGCSASRLADSRDSVDIDVAQESDSWIARFRSRYTGRTTWPPWDGTSEGMQILIEEEALEDAEQSHGDRLITGERLDWDP